MNAPEERMRLDNGREVKIRPIGPRDREAEREFILALSPEVRRYRFLEQMNDPSEALLDRLLNVDHANDEAFVAIACDGSEAGAIVGVSRYAVGTDPEACEIALVVRDAWRPSNLKGALLERLVQAARERGLRRMVSIDSADNRYMRAFAPVHGFTSTPDPDDSTQVLYHRDL